MNHFQGFTHPVIGGYHAMLRFAENGQPEAAKGPGGKPIVFPTEAEAWKAVTDHLLKYINGKMRRDGEVIPAREAADRIFRKGRMIPVGHR